MPDHWHASQYGAPDLFDRSGTARIGDTVRVDREGSGARHVLRNPDACVISVIVGIVDSTYLEY